MKRITAIVRPEKLDDVEAALERVGVPGVTVKEVRGYGRQKGHVEIYRGREYVVRLRPKVEIDIVVDDDDVESVVLAIRNAARTGAAGDGRIFVQPVDESYQIRTGAVAR